MAVFVLAQAFAFENSLTMTPMPPLIDFSRSLYSLLRDGVCVEAPYTENFDAYPDGGAPSHFSTHVSGGGVYFFRLGYPKSKRHRRCVSQPCFGRCCGGLARSTSPIWHRVISFYRRLSWLMVTARFSQHS